LQEAPVILAGNHEQKKKYLSRMIEEPLIAVGLQFYSSNFDCCRFAVSFIKL
jgi:hypothetical protein